MQFTSSAIQSISDVTDTNEVTIVFQNGRPYTYMVSDADAWENDLADVISESESVGSFVNRAIRSGVLNQVAVAVWLLHWPVREGVIKYTSLTHSSLHSNGSNHVQQNDQSDSHFRLHDEESDAP